MGDGYAFGVPGRAGGEDDVSQRFPVGVAVDPAPRADRAGHGRDLVDSQHVRHLHRKLRPEHRLGTDHPDRAGRDEVADPRCGQRRVDRHPRRAGPQTATAAITCSHPLAIRMPTTLPGPAPAARRAPASRYDPASTSPWVSARRGVSTASAAGLQRSPSRTRRSSRAAGKVTAVSFTAAGPVPARPGRQSRGAARWTRRRPRAGARKAAHIASMRPGGNASAT